MPVGDDEIPIVGVEVYPEPSLLRYILSIYPLLTVPVISGTTLAVDPVPIKFNVVIKPSS